MYRETQDRRPKRPSRAAPARPDRAEGALGLSSSPNLYDPSKITACYTMEYRAGGECVRLVPPPEVTREVAKRRGYGGIGGRRAVRQKITEFTRKSQLALRRKFDCLQEKHRKRCLFLTMTYQTNMLDGEQAHKDFNAFDAALRRKFGQGSGTMWKMEQQGRGSIHFHLLAFGVKRIPWDWLADTWARIVAHGGPINEQQRKAGTSIELAEKGKVRSYLEKYIAKVTKPGEEETPEIDNPGRYWGARRMEQFFAPKVELPLDLPAAKELPRILDGLRRSSIRRQWALKPENAKVLRFNAMVVSQHRRPYRLVSPVTHARLWETNVHTFPASDLWMLRWAKKRRKCTLQQRSYWSLAVGDLVPQLAHWLYTLGQVVDPLSVPLRERLHRHKQSRSVLAL